MTAAGGEGRIHSVPSPQSSVLFFGMFGPLSRAPLAALLTAGVDVRAIVVPPRGAGTGTARPRRLARPPGWEARPRSLPALLGRTVVDLAWEHDIPVLEVGGLGGETARALATFAPDLDLIAVSCFPFRLPDALLALPRLGCLNVHPAPLPRHRGPAPLFWIFRGGSGRGGVTVHLMDRGLDSGPIVTQEGFDLGDGLTGAELELRCAALGADLLTAAIRDLAAGTAAPRAQDEAFATTEPWPRASDFVITPDWPARRAFNFIRGTAGWGHPHVIAIGGAQLTVRAAVAYDPAARLGAPFLEDTSEVRVQCSPGVLTITTIGNGG